MNINEFDVIKFNECLNSEGIVVKRFREHTKASEKYIDVVFKKNNIGLWSGSIPYYYRRTGVFIENPNELIEYLKKIYPLFDIDKIKKFKASEAKRWNVEMSKKQTTKAFFDILLDLNWKSVKYDLPSNPNWARRIQDIKEFGYTLATDTNRKVEGKNETGTHILLIPLPKGGVTGYEVMSPKFRTKVIDSLNSINVYEFSKSNKHGLLPDHKFPEIRWDDKTKSENPDEMSKEKIKEKFQLLDNQRNQQKREVCRKCFQTDKRGKLFGINYFYSGDENWPTNIEKIGKEAEKGCIGCGWYDIEKWRASLNSLLND